MPKLSQVFALADRYGATDVQFNIETKIDPTVPDDTVDPQTFTEKVLGVIKTSHKGHQSLLQSFDWRTLVAAKELMPGLRTVALAQPSTIQEGQDGTSPWTAGIDVDAAPYDGDVARAARAIGASVLSPTYGVGTWGTPSFAWYLTPAMVASAHARGLKVVPWTVDDPPAIEAVLDLGVDGIISDYPDRLRRRSRPVGSRCPPRSPRRSTSRRTAAAAPTGPRTRSPRTPTGWPTAPTRSRWTSA